MNENTTTETVDYAALVVEYADAADAAYRAFQTELVPTHMEVAGQQVQPGDALVDSLSKVEAVRDGSSKRILKLEGKKTEVRIDPAEKVKITRLRATEESAAEQKGLYEERRAAILIAQHAAEPEADKAKLDEYMAKGWYEQVAVYAAGLAAGEQVRGEWLTAAAVVAKGKMTAVEALAELERRLVDACISGYDAPTWSGGFTVKNAIQQSIVTNRQKAAQSASRGW